jgi:hypothetical protein
MEFVGLFDKMFDALNERAKAERLAFKTIKEAAKLARAAKRKKP